MPTPDWSSDPRLQERRLTRRSPVSWPVRLWLEENLFMPGRAVDLGRGGICIHVASSLPVVLLRVGERYRLEMCPGFAEEIACVVEVRYLSEEGVGLWIKETLPLLRRDRRQAPGAPRP